MAVSDPQGEANYHAARRAYPAQAIVDLAAIRDNMRHLVGVVGESSGTTEVMGVVKADAYGHGLVPVALAALAGGATWLGTAQAREALLLRAAGIGPDRAHILTWVNNPLCAPYGELIANSIDLSVATLTAVERIADAARATGLTARVHVKVDTGFGRNGFTLEQLPEAISALRPLIDEGVLDVVGQWSHLAVADAPQDAGFVHETDMQIERFERFTSELRAGGIDPRVRHLANTAATLTRPQIHYDLVRPGIALYGYEADPAMGTPGDFGLTPAMTLQAQLSSVKDVPAGSGLSYGRVYLTGERTSVAIVPVGYADGIHRSASGFDEAARATNTNPVARCASTPRTVPSSCASAGACAWTSSSSTCTAPRRNSACTSATPCVCSAPAPAKRPPSRPPTTGRARPTQSATRSSHACATACRACTCTRAACCLQKTWHASTRSRCSSAPL